MDRLSASVARLFPSLESSSTSRTRRHEYAPLNQPGIESPRSSSLSFERTRDVGSGNNRGEGATLGRDGVQLHGERLTQSRFSRLEYLIFAIVGVGMLWPWNMFLAAFPYFSARLAASPALRRASHSAIISTSTGVNLIANFVLMRPSAQRAASYPSRVTWALVGHGVVFVVLMLSTFFAGEATLATASEPVLLPSAYSFTAALPDDDAAAKSGAVGYFVFVLTAVAAAACCTGVLQNGAFALASGLGRPEYTAAIMAGHGVAGVLPPLARMASVLIAASNPPSLVAVLKRNGNSRGYDHGSGGPVNDEPDVVTAPADEQAARLYFFAAVVVCVTTLIAFRPLVARYRRCLASSIAVSASDDLVEARRVAARYSSTNKSSRNSPDSTTSSSQQGRTPLPAPALGTTDPQDDQHEQEQRSVTAEATGSGDHHRVRHFHPRTHHERTAVPLRELWQQLNMEAIALFLCFAVAMVSPVYTARVMSVDWHGEQGLPDKARTSRPVTADPAFFVPYAFFWWNLGDLVGRIAWSAMPGFLHRWWSSSSSPTAGGAQQPQSTQRRPLGWWLVAAAVARAIFIPLYVLFCNLDGRGGAWITMPSDWMYLLMVQLPFGLTTGALATACMMAATTTSTVSTSTPAAAVAVASAGNDRELDVDGYDEEEQNELGMLRNSTDREQGCNAGGGRSVRQEREAAGAFMSFVLMAGLTTGSLASFAL